MVTEKQEMILEILKKEGKTATTKIAFLISCNFYAAQEILESLESEGKIIKEENGNATYWKILEESNDGI